MNKTLKGILFLILGGLLWGTGMWMIDYGLTHYVPGVWYPFTFIMLMIGGFFIFLNGLITLFANDETGGNK